MNPEISQVCFFQPVLDGLRNAGVDPQPLLVSSGLDRFNLENPQHYVPSNVMYQFFVAIREQQGIKDLLEAFDAEIDLFSLSQWGEMIAYTPDLLTALQTAEKYDQVVNSHERAGLDINGATAKFWIQLIDNPAAGREQADYINIALIISGFRHAGGPDWIPLEIHLQSDCPPNLDTLLPPGSNTRVLTGQPATAIVFPTSMLAMPMAGEGQLVEHSNPSANVPDSLAHRIKQLLDSLNINQKPVITMIADMVESSPRTLQRSLVDEGTSFSEVVDQWRLKTAIGLLADPAVRIKDISEQLYYSNAPNFERAFRRWTSTTPNRYRDAH